MVGECEQESAKGESHVIYMRLGTVHGTARAVPQTVASDRRRTIFISGEDHVLSVSTDPMYKHRQDVLYAIDNRLPGQYK